MGRAHLCSAAVVGNNTELVESAFEAWNRGEIEAFAEYAAPDVVWLEVSGRPEGDGAELHGRDRLRRSLESLFEAWASYRLEPQEIHDLGDRVVAVVREIARGRASGARVDGLWGYVITIRESKFVRVEAYRDPALALEAAGSGERQVGA
jgi:uncharacterized protein (TIGR02246 family)